MKNRLIPASRLTIIFILAVVLSGSVLTYFSISNISNLKELTEKRVMEEQRELSSRFSSELQNTISKLTSGWNKSIIQPRELKDSLLNIANKEGFIIQSFILDGNGRFLYPNFMGISENKLSDKISAGFISAFRKGEKAEFSENNLRKAKESYLECLGLSAGGNDSAKSINALGRVAVKSGSQREAAGWYYALTEKHFSELTGEGTPYVYFALPPLLKIEKDSEKLTEVVADCLGKTDSGDIPINFYTEEWLNRIAEWLKENSPGNNDKLTAIHHLFIRLMQMVRFVNGYGGEITEFSEKISPGNSRQDSSGVQVFSSFPGNDTTLLLMNAGLANPAGFLINRRIFLDYLAKITLQSGLEFEYKIDFPDGYTSDKPGDKLVYSTQLNPWLPAQTIRINLKNEEVLNKFILRRSLIYGVSSILLLVAMLLGVILILRDVAREKHLARLRSDFISNVTHELKTPLTSIRMFAESMMMGRVKSTAVQKEYLSVVVNESERLKRMINNILEFSKIERAKQEFHMVESDLSELLHSALKEMWYWMEERQFRVITEIDPDIRAKVDPEKFRQVFTNLLSNAIKFSGESNEIVIRLYKTNSLVTAEFEDKGIGIAENEQSNIFKPFYRVDQKERGEITGTGLGLTVVKEIVEAHGGRILVESEPGKGSTFTVRIPLGDM